MQLSDALGVQRGEIVAFVGAGGKTSALVRLSRELRQKNWRVLATTTTRIAENELRRFPYAVRMADIQDWQMLSALLNLHGMVFIYEDIFQGKVIGLTPDTISHMVDNVDSDTTLIEADGARRLLMKVPYAHEPVLPEDVSLVVPIASMEALGKPLNSHTVYNYEEAIERYGFSKNGEIQPAWIAQILRDETLGLKNIPETARIVPILNRVEEAFLNRLKARQIARMILKQPRIQAVAIGRVQRKNNPIFEVQKRVAAIILAGGLSRRMGQPKPLLPWGNKTVIETIVHCLQPLRLADIVVVTGHKSQAIEKALKGTDVHTIHNPGYASGEMVSSLQTGLRALDSSIAACMVFLGDQPQISPRLVNEIVTTYCEGQGNIVAPSYMKRRGHPILIDRYFWPELLDLPSGSSPRDVINRHNDEITYVLARDDTILRDMDTPEQYQIELRRAGLA